MIRPTRVEVDVSAVAANARILRAHTGTALYAVVKADAYGHGAVAIAEALAAAGVVDGFAVSLVEEGVVLRDAGVTLPVLVMGPAQRGGHDEMAARDLTPVISHPGDWASVADSGRRRQRPVDVHLKIDSGMGRLGLTGAEAASLAGPGATGGGGARIVGLMTHFASADLDDPSDGDCLTYRQLARFAEADRAVVGAGAIVEIRHAANSSGAMLFPSSRLDLVRCGLALYGNGRWNVEAALAAPRRQAMRLVSAVAQLRDVPRGGTVGYGASWTARRETRAAILPVGYADGIGRRATGTAEVLIRGRRCPLIGAVSMDIVVVDVTDLGPAVAVGDDAVLLGSSAAGGPPITTAELATWTGLTEYEVTCGMSKRVPRVYVFDEEAA